MAATASSAVSAATATTMPSPRLNTRLISASVTPPCRRISEKMRGTSQVPRSRTARVSSGSIRGDVAGEAAPGDVGDGVHVGRGHRRPHGRRVDDRRAQELLAQGDRSPGPCRTVEGQPGPVAEHMAGERVAVGAEPGRRQADEGVTDPDATGPEDAVALHHADGEPHEVELAGLHDAGVFGRLPAEEGGPHLPAALGHAGDEIRHLGRIEVPDRDVVEQEQRLRPLAHEVVDAHGHEVEADRVEAGDLLGNECLGADAVGAGDEDGLAVAAGGQLEEATEAAEAAEDLGPVGRAGQRPDEVDGPLGGGDVDAGRRVGGRAFDRVPVGTAAGR